MPEDAVVKRFFAAKGFGFIEADGGEELFVHQSQIQTEGFRKLITGQKVSFTRAEVDGKSQATKVTVTGEAPPRPPKEKKEGGEGSLNIRIRDQTGEETFFKVKKTTKLDKVFNAYSTRKGVAATSLRFLFDGSRVRGDQTPADIDMEDGDQLDCMLEQQGGL